MLSLLGAEELPKGAIVATARLVDVLPTWSAQVPPLEEHLGDFSPKRHAWKFVDVVRLACPVPAKGHLDCGPFLETCKRRSCGVVDDADGPRNWIMPIMNYTTKVPADRTVAEISQLLVKKGATEIMTSFDDDAKPVALKWRIRSRHGPLSFSMPVRVDAIYEVMTRQRVMATNAVARREQAYRTAWRIIKDWIEAQIALLKRSQSEIRRSMG